MFASLLGPLPRLRPGAPGAVDPVDEVRAAVALQIEAGLGVLTDGRTTPALPAVDAWRATASLAGEHPVKAILPGPFALAAESAARGATSRAERERAVLGAVERLRGEIDALVGAGCPYVQIDEPAAVMPGGERGATLFDGDRDRALFGVAHRRLTDGVAATHLSLALGAGAEALGAAPLIEAGYASYYLDLINGPDDWRVAAVIPGDRGLVCGALDPASPGRSDLEVLVWAAHYAASTKGRGLDRVGLAPAPGLELLDRAAAEAKARVLGEAARLAMLPREELAARIDPRALGR